MLFWIILLVALSVGLGYAIIASNNVWQPILCGVGILLYVGILYLYYVNDKAKAQVEVLQDFGIEKIEDTYNLSQAELDKKYKITTMNEIYYFEKNTN